MSLMDDYPIIRRLIDDHGMACLAPGMDGHPAGDWLLFLPCHVRPGLETPDVAAILPELTKSFGLPAALADPELEVKVRAELDGIGLPALVVMREDAILGAIPRMRDWDDYCVRIPALLSPATC